MRFGLCHIRSPGSSPTPVPRFESHSGSSIRVGLCAGERLPPTTQASRCGLGAAGVVAATWRTAAWWSPKWTGPAGTAKQADGIERSAYTGELSTDLFKFRNRCPRTTTGPKQARSTSPLTARKHSAPGSTSPGCCASRPSTRPEATCSASRAGWTPQTFNAKNQKSLLTVCSPDPQ